MVNPYETAMFVPSTSILSENHGTFRSSSGASTRVPEVPGAPDDVGAVPGVGEKEDFNP